MKSIILVILILFIATGCNEIKKINKSSSEQKEEQKTEPKNEVKNQDNQTQPQSANNKGENVNKGAGNTKGIDDLSYDISTLPTDLNYEGKMIAGARWKDVNGQNYLLISETKEKTKKGKFDDYSRDKELYVYHYISQGSDNKLLWKVQDYVRDCEFDLTLSYINNSLSITDLNENGIAESTFLYQMSCKSDVSPDDMKLIMHESDTKYAIRGIMNLNVQGKRMQDGKMVVDNSFNDAPSGFLDYAKSQWKKYGTQNY